MTDALASHAARAESRVTRSSSCRARIGLAPRTLLVLFFVLRGRLCSNHIPILMTEVVFCVKNQAASQPDHFDPAYPVAEMPCCVVVCVGYMQTTARTM